MKTYLTNEQFVTLFWELYTRRLQYNQTGANRCDLILWQLFTEFEKDIKDTLEGSLYGIETYDGEDAGGYIGYQFHKSFRQTDVIEHRYIDSIIWQLLQDAPLFWKCMKNAGNILICVNAEELYNDEV